jgi:hypothetical protein
MLCQGANLKRCLRTSGERLTPAKPLHHESVQCVPESACRIRGDNPTVNRAFSVLDMLGFAGPKLEDQECLAIPAKMCGHSYLSAYLMKPRLASKVDSVGRRQLAHGAHALVSVAGAAGGQIATVLG